MLELLNWIFFLKYLALRRKSIFRRSWIWSYWKPTKFSLTVFLTYMYVCMDYVCHMCGGQKTSLCSWFSPTTVSDPGIELIRPAEKKCLHPLSQFPNWLALSSSCSRNTPFCLRQFVIDSSYVQPRVWSWGSKFYLFVSFCVCGSGIKPGALSMLVSDLPLGHIPDDITLKC